MILTNVLKSANSYILNMDIGRTPKVFVLSTLIRGGGGKDISINSGLFPLIVFEIKLFHSAFEPVY